jgi:hypothetical protein
MTHWVHINLFPECFIQLQAELTHHPRLQEILQQQPGTEWEIRLAQIAHYCSVILDGDYLPEDVERVCEILRIKLVELREDNRGLVVITSDSVH